MIPEAENYRRELTKLRYGRPVYDPEPGDYDRVRIGDVGYFVHLGGFCRFFNVLYPKDHAINSDGVPLGFVPMGEVYRRWRPSNPIRPGVICISRVKEIGGELEINDDVLPIGAKITLSSTEQHWAALIISQHAIRKDAKFEGAFEDYIKKNHQSWLGFALEKGFRIDLKEIVLVTGLDMTHEWATVSAENWNKDWEVSLDVKSPGSGRIAASAWCSWTSSVKLPLRFGPFHPQSQNLPPNEATSTLRNLTQPNSLMFIDNVDSQASDSDEPNQCIFMRGFRVIPRPWVRIKAAAEPKNEYEGDDGARDQSPQTMVASIGLDSDDSLGSEDNDLIESDEALKATQDYIFKNSDADFAVLHDYDLYKFSALHGENEHEDTLPGESEKYKPQGFKLKLETVNGVKVASLNFREGTEESKLGKLSTTNETLDVPNKFDGKSSTSAHARSLEEPVQTEKLNESSKSEQQIPDFSSPPQLSQEGPGRTLDNIYTLAGAHLERMRTEGGARVRGIGGSRARKKGKSYKG